MRLPNSEHAARPWRIHELTPDFRLEDVWALPTPGGPGDFSRLMETLPRLLAEGEDSQDSPRAVRFLWAIRRKVGAMLGWDGPNATRRSGRSTLQGRLPVDLRDGPSGPDLPDDDFTPLYLTADEWASEIVNRTVHGVLHVGWVPDGSGGYRGQMAIYVKPNGLLGTAYMASIKPFRYLIIYPAMLKQIERAWQAGG